MDIYKILEIGIGPLVSFIIMWMTFIFQSKKSKQQLKCHKDQFETTSKN